MEKFSKLEYKRPDMKQVRRELTSLAKEFEGAKSYPEARTVYLKIEAATQELATMVVLAHVRNTIDLTDKFYDEENAFFNRSLPLLTPVQKKMTAALLHSPFRGDFEAEFGKQLTLSAELEDRTMSRKIMLDQVRENLLETTYQKIAGGCKTVFEGKECNFYGLLKYMEDPDRAVRKAAFEAWAKLYETAAPELDAVYDKLIELRCKIARKMNFDSYIDYAHLSRQRVDYTPADVAKFRQQIVDVVVPACAEIRRKQAERIGVDKLEYYDETFFFPGGNPDPHGTVDELVSAANAMYRELSPETGEFFDFMVQNELFDLQTRPGKHLGGYCTSLMKYKAPFIFSNFNGTSADVDVLTHEAGHAFEYYLSSRCQPIADYAHSTSEINEIHSMSMEHFAYPWMDKFFGERADEYRYAHLCGALLVIPYIVAVDEFQHRVYAERPDAAGRRAVWKELEQKYLPWRDYDGNAFLEGGGFWMQKQHIFLYPFYYIDYSLAQMGAFEFYGRNEDDHAAAWNDYLRLCRAGGSKGYFELLELAGLSNPFREGSVKKAVDRVVADIAAAKF